LGGGEGAGVSFHRGVWPKMSDKILAFGWYRHFLREQSKSSVLMAGSFIMLYSTIPAGVNALSTRVRQ